MHLRAKHGDPMVQVLQQGLLTVTFILRLHSGGQHYENITYLSIMTLNIII